MWTTPVAAADFVQQAVTGITTLGLGGIILGVLGLAAAIGLVWRRIKPRGM